MAIPYYYIWSYSILPHHPSSHLLILACTSEKISFVVFFLPTLLDACTFLSQEFQSLCNCIYLSTPFHPLRTTQNTSWYPTIHREPRCTYGTYTSSYQVILSLCPSNFVLSCWCQGLRAVKTDETGYWRLILAQFHCIHFLYVETLGFSLTFCGLNRWLEVLLFGIAGAISLVASAVFCVLWDGFFDSSMMSPRKVFADFAAAFQVFKLHENETRSGVGSCPDAGWSFVAVQQCYVREEQGHLDPLVLGVVPPGFPNVGLVALFVNCTCTSTAAC